MWKSRENKVNNKITKNHIQSTKDYNVKERNFDIKAS